MARRGRMTWPRQAISDGTSRNGVLGFDSPAGQARFSQKGGLRSRLHFASVHVLRRFPWWPPKLTHTASGVCSLSSSPGHTPDPGSQLLGGRKGRASAPSSAIIGFAESTPGPDTSAKSITYLSFG